MIHRINMQSLTHKYAMIKFDKKYFTLCVFSILLLQGCSSTNPSFSDMSQSYQNLMESYNLNSTLLNVVRASKNRPLSFLAIPSITGTGSINESAGLSANILSSLPSTVGGFFSAGAGTYYTGGAQATLGRSFTFTQSSMDNAEFQRQILTPISLETINYFNSRHTNKELLFSMTLSAIEIKYPNQAPEIYNNYPDSRSYGEFQNLLHRLVQNGLSTQMLETKENIGPLMPKIFRNKEVFQYLDAKDKQNLSLEEVSTLDGTRFQLVQTHRKANICFVRNADAQEVIAEFGDSFFCFNHFDAYDKKKKYAALNESTNEHHHKTSIRFITRSNHEIFDYLGAILRAQIKNPENIPSINNKTPSTDDVPLIIKNIPILVIEKNKSSSKALATTAYDDDVYSIPVENNGYSAVVVNLLSQLLALNRVPGSIPPSPAILIK